MSIEIIPTADSDFEKFDDFLGQYPEVARNSLIELSSCYSLWEDNKLLAVFGVIIRDLSQPFNCWLVPLADNLANTKSLRAIRKAIADLENKAKYIFQRFSLVTNAPDDRAARWLRFLGFYHCHSDYYRKDLSWV